jgi:carboxyl-terminal processing protease
MNKMKRSHRVISYCLIFGITFLFGWESASYYILKKSAQHIVQQESVSPMAAFTSLIMPESAKADMTLFWKVWGLLQESYVTEENLDKQDMVYGSIKGMVGSLEDPFTTFMTPDETSEFDQSLNGQLQGIGAELTVKKQALTVVTPLKNSPAERAGILPGDVVYKIDGDLTGEMTLFDAIMRIRGQSGTNVTLTIIREGKEDPFDVQIKREQVNIESVVLEDQGDGVFLISIYQFNDKTTVELDKIINQVILKEPKGIILDLRNNGGGYLEVSVDIVSAFVEGNKKVVEIKRRNEKDNQQMLVHGNAALPNIPIVVLINGGSASASEIVAGALQDHKRAVIMGETSFGKGSVQEVSKLSDGSSIRMTIAKWYTPNGNNIDEVGITPDIVVEYTAEDFQEDLDPQLAAATDYLKNL